MSEESVEISKSNQIKCTNLEKFKQIDSEEFEKILHLTNKKPILTPKGDRRKPGFAKIEISDQNNQSDDCLYHNVSSSTRNSLVKNICSFLENKIQKNSDINNNQFKKRVSLENDLFSESSFSDSFNPKISISLNSLDYTIKCTEFDAFEQSNNNNNNNDEAKKDDKSKSKSKDKNREKERSRKSEKKTDESERRKRSKSREKEKKKTRRSLAKIDKNENQEKNLNIESSDNPNNLINPPELRIELEDDKHSTQIKVEEKILDEPQLINPELEIPDHDIQTSDYSENEMPHEQENILEYKDYSEAAQEINSNVEVHDDQTEILNLGRVSNATSSFSDFKNSVNFSTSTKKQEDNLKPNLPLQTANKILQYISSFISVTTPENKNLWLSLIEKTGDSIIDILTMKDDENRNIWLTWLKDQCTSLDQLSKDLINDIEAKILRIEYKNC